MKGHAGFGRYDDDPEKIGCPYARSDMTPCVSRDGVSALTDDGKCVGCGRTPAEILAEITEEAGSECIVYGQDTVETLVKTVRVISQAKPV